MRKRQEQLLAYLEQQQKSSVEELAELLSVSLETIRRDLREMSEKGLLVRTHGGAVSKSHSDLGSPFENRQKRNLEQKQRVAQAAIQYITEGMVIGLDASTTSWCVAQQLPNISCTVVTNSLHNIQALSAKSNIKIISTGGTFSPKYEAFYGPLAESLFDRLHIDVGFFSCSGIGMSGDIWESNELNSSTKIRMMNVCKKKILLADHSKIGRQNLMKLGNLSDIDQLIIDDLSESYLLFCQENQISFKIA